jgi:metallo-beta-lactamase family protein
VDITFLGAAGTVTGSKYLLRAGGRTLLVDCGLFQGHKELRLRNREPFPIPPSQIDAVVLTHAHLDHSGWLPVLVREGYGGPVYCTPATAELCEILLLDSAHIQEEEAEFANRHRTSKHQPALPLYTIIDAERAVSRLRAVDWAVEKPLGGDAAFRYDPSGHMSGAASITLRAEGKTIVFSGDLGRTGDPLLPDPVPPGEADYLLVESTYGNRMHYPGDPADELAAVVNETVKRGGTVLIPAFAVGRAQLLMWHIWKLKREGRIPDLPVFLDSPMAGRATAVFRDHPETHHLTPEETEAVVAAAQPADTVAQSKAIGRMSYPRIVISASGMATGGRVLHHLKVMAPDSANTILFAGYQAAGTRGAQMVGGARTVRIHGADVAVNAQVEVLDGLSAHADYTEILGWLSSLERAPRRTFIVHGEPQAAEALRDRIEERFRWPCVIPQHLHHEVLE